MSLGSNLERIVSDYLAGEYETYEPQGVPSPESIALVNKAAKLEATTLFVDVRQSSDITNAFRRRTAAKMVKGYFDGAVRIVRANDGEVRSFNGDGLLAGGGPWCDGLRSWAHLLRAHPGLGHAVAGGSPEVYPRRRPLLTSGA